MQQDEQKKIGFEIKIRAEVDPHTHTQRKFQRVRVNYADRGFVQ